MNEAQAQARSFARVREHSPQKGAPSLRDDGIADKFTLEAMMRRFAEDLGASGSALTCTESQSKFTLLYSEAPIDVLQSIPSVLDHRLEQAAETNSSTESWSEFTLDQQLWSMLNVPIHVGRFRFSVLAFFRGSSRLTRAGAKALHGIRPLLAGFLTLWATGSQLRGRVDSLSNALHQSSTGIILLNSDGAIIFTNHAADRMLTTGETIRRNGAFISAKRLSEALQLQIGIEHVINSWEGDAREAIPVIALSRGGKSRPLMVAIVAAGTAPAAGSGAVLHLFDPDQDVEPLLAPVCRIYGLSPVEVKLTCLLVGGACVAEAATKMRIKEQTARTYLKQIFSKTDVSRQADLIRLMLTSVVPPSGAGSLRAT